MKSKLCSLETSARNLDLARSLRPLLLKKNSFHFKTLLFLSNTFTLQVTFPLLILSNTLTLQVSFLDVLASYLRTLDSPLASKMMTYEKRNLRKTKNAGSQKECSYLVHAGQLRASIIKPQHHEIPCWRRKKWRERREWVFCKMPGKTLYWRGKKHSLLITRCGRQSRLLHCSAASPPIPIVLRFY